MRLLKAILNYSDLEHKTRAKSGFFQSFINSNVTTASSQVNTAVGAADPKDSDNYFAQGWLQFLRIQKQRWKDPSHISNKNLWWDYHNHRGGDVFPLVGSRAGRECYLT